jgi:hypothetical protein
MNDSYPRPPRRICRRLPLLADLREDVVAGGTLLAQELVTPVAVVPRRRHADHNAWWCRKPRKRLGQEPCPPHPAVADAGLFGVRPAPHYVLACQVNDGVYPFDPVSVYLTRRRVPPDGIPRCASGTRQAPHLMPLFLQSWN